MPYPLDISYPQTQLGINVNKVHPLWIMFGYVIGIMTALGTIAYFLKEKNPVESVNDWC